MSFLNLGILAHVDAGKTSLTERLLYEAGVITSLGSVDQGSTRTDSMDLERRRGITIRAAVTTFAIGDLLVNLLDTPGHPDFIAEVERSLGVLDAAVLVLSAVEGVQPQTVIIWRALQRIGVPTLLLVNKVDRAGSDVDRAVQQVRARLTPHAVVLTRVRGEGSAQARVRAVSLRQQAVVTAVAEADERVLARWVEGAPPTEREIRRALRRGVRDGALAPVVFASAITGTGIPELRAVVTGLLPRAPQQDAPVAGEVFAVDRDERGRRAWVRMWSGEVGVREGVCLSGRPAERVTEVAVSVAGAPQACAVVRAGQIAVLRGLAGARVGDTIGPPSGRRVHRFAPATLQALVEPVDPTRRTALFAALSELADEDPLIDLRLDAAAGEAAVSLHGEVQKEVLAALLEERFGVQARFLATSVVCIERVVGAGEALEAIKVGGNPYLATLGLRIEAAPTGHGLEFSPGIEPGNLPPAFVAATEEGVRSALGQGRHGWAVTDCVVTMTKSGYCPRQSHAHQKFSKAMSTVGADFRNLAPVVVMAALERAGTRVCQPMHRFELDLPDSSFSAVTAALGRLGAVTLGSSWGIERTRLEGHLPSARIPDLTRALPDLTGGEGVLVASLDHYAPVPDDAPPPSRRRRGIDPRDRRTWFRDVPR